MIAAPKLCRVSIAVDDADEAAAEFGRIFGIEFGVSDADRKQVRVAVADDITFVQDATPDGKSSISHEYWNGGLVNIGFKVPDESFEEAKELWEQRGLVAWNYVEMQSDSETAGFKCYSFKPVAGVMVSLYSYPGDSFTAASQSAPATNWVEENFPVR
jgi:hypothetical protein